MTHICEAERHQKVRPTDRLAARFLNNITGYHSHMGQSADRGIRGHSDGRSDIYVRQLDAQRHSRPRTRTPHMHARMHAPINA